VNRKQFLRQLENEILAAWDYFASTGLHITEEEADAWLAKLEAGENIEPPDPHV
jgi:predicted transcriptional regulator